MMDAELKGKWVEALRSGKYKQGRNVLRNLDGAYCCLGVLCEVASIPYTSDDSGRTPLPTRILPASAQVDLTRINDGDTLHEIKSHSFPEIADYIEANL